MKNKKQTIFLITLFSILFVALSIFMILLLKGKYQFNGFVSTKISDTLVIDQTFQTQLKDVYVESSAGNIYIKESKDDHVKVVIYGDREKTIFNTDDDKLLIKSDMGKCKGFCLNQLVAKIEVYIPNNYSQKMTIINKYGDVKVDQFLQCNFDIKLDYGDVLVKGGNIVVIKNQSGDIELKEATMADIYQNYGDIEVGKVASIIAKNNYGDIFIDEVTNDLDLENDCGDIEIDKATLKKDSKIIVDLGDITIDKMYGVHIDVKNQLGDVKVNYNDEESGVILKIKNDLGDVKINN